MPSFGSQSPATAVDGISIQNAAGAIAQKSEILSGPVITSNFTTTSATLVDVTGMSVTLASTSNVASELKVILRWSTSAAATVTFSITATAGTLEYVWVVTEVTGTAATGITRNADGVRAAAGVSAGNANLDGFISGATSGATVKVQASVSGGVTLTVFIGSVLYATF